MSEKECHLEEENSSEGEDLEEDHLEDYIVNLIGKLLSEKLGDLQSNILEGLQCSQTVLSSNLNTLSDQINKLRVLMQSSGNMHSMTSGIQTSHLGVKQPSVRKFGPNFINTSQ